MTRPKAYDPQPEQKYQILTRDPQYGTEWEHCDYAGDRAELKHLLTEYRLAYGSTWQFQTITLPRKFWPKATNTKE